MKKTILFLLISLSVNSQTLIKYNQLQPAFGNNTTFLGSTDNRSLLFKTNGVQRMKVDSIGRSNLTGSVTMGTGTVAANTTSLGIVRIKQGSSWLDFGELASANGAIWINQTSPNTSNYSFLGNGISSIFNAPTGGSNIFRINNTTVGTINSTGFALTGTMSVSGTSTLTGSVNFGDDAQFSTNQAFDLAKTGRIYYNSASGLAIIGRVGSAHNISIATPFGVNLFRNIAGTNNVNLTQDGSVVIGTGSPVNASAVLEAVSTTKGFLPPRMTATQGSAISSPTEGLMIYVTDTNGTFTTKGWWGYDGAAWQKLNN